MDSRELKGLEIAARSKIAYTDGIWHVPSQSRKTKTYRVILKPGDDRCDCEDFGLTAKPCKHIHAARFVRERDHGGEVAEIDTDTLPPKKTYKRDWSKYNLAQQTEQRRFEALLFDLCRGLDRSPQPKTGRRRTEFSDMIFVCGLKVYSTFGCRRFAGDLEDALGKGYVSHKINSASVCSYLESDLLTPVLERLVVLSSLPLRVVERDFAPDSSGFATSRYDRWYDEKYKMTRTGKRWVKAHIVCGVKTHVVTAVQILHQDAGDSPQFRPLIETTAENFKIREVSADKAYLSHDNLELVEKLGGTPYIPFKVNSQPGEAGSLWEKMYLFYMLHREEFLAHYHKRSNVETAFSMVQAKFCPYVRSRTDTAMKNEVLTKFIAHNICVVHQSHIELGIEPVFWRDEQQPAVLPFARHG